MAAMRGIERRKAYQSMRANLRAEVAVGVAPANLDGNALYPRFLTLVVLINLGTEFVAFGPAQVHTQQHLGPILRIYTTAARVNTHDRVACIVFTVEHERELQLLDILLDIPQ